MEYCKTCGASFILSKSGVRYRKANKIDMESCQHCIASIAIKRTKSIMDQTKIDEINQKISNAHKNRSKEEKEKTSVLLKSIIDQRSDEKKQEIIQKMICTNKSKSIEERKKKSEKISKSWNDKSDGEKAIIGQRKSIAIKAFYKNESNEDRINRIARMSLAQLNRSEEDKADSLIKFKNTMKNRSLYEMELWKKRISDYYKNESLNDFEIRSYRNACGKVLSDKNKSKTECDLLFIFKKFHIDTEYGYASKTVHPEFYKTFPINPVTNQKVFPHHAWDFKVGNILIDIDGSEHTIQPKEFITKDGIDVGGLIQFNDSQRPYQADGMDAYIILAYNDKISDAISVFNLQNGEYITFGVFLNMIKNKGE